MSLYVDCKNDQKSTKYNKNNVIPIFLVTHLATACFSAQMQKKNRDAKHLHRIAGCLMLIRLASNEKEDSKTLKVQLIDVDLSDHF